MRWIYQASLQIGDMNKTPLTLIVLGDSAHRLILRYFSQKKVAVQKRRNEFVATVVYVNNALPMRLITMRDMVYGVVYLSANDESLSGRGYKRKLGLRLYAEALQGGFFAEEGEGVI